MHQRPDSLVSMRCHLIGSNGLWAAVAAGDWREWQNEAKLAFLSLDLRGARTQDLEGNRGTVAT